MFESIIAKQSVLDTNDEAVENCAHDSPKEKANSSSPLHVHAKNCSPRGPRHIPSYTRATEHKTDRRRSDEEEEGQRGVPEIWRRELQWAPLRREERSQVPGVQRNKSRKASKIVRNRNRKVENDEFTTVENDVQFCDTTGGNGTLNKMYIYCSSWNWPYK